jgi:hypothetical protein
MPGFEKDSSEKQENSLKESRIRSIIKLYYSKPEIQKVLFSFSQNREICPRYFESFGKRPDSFQYESDIFELVKKGATSFHCSEEIWSDALKLTTNLTKTQLDNLREGWDLLIDIDSRYIDYSKIAAEVILDFLKLHRVKNVGIKFSGSKGMHLIIPWKAFPKQINGLETKNQFPEFPRILVQYINSQVKQQLIEKISDLTRPSKYIKDFKVSEQVMPDLILVSPRHLFRMPYSLHEKTALASIVLSREELKNFQMKDAEPLKVKVRDFIPDCKEGEASQLVIQALDWYAHNVNNESKKTETSEFKPVKILNLSDKTFPPSIQKILQGVEDGRKRALFVLINFFRSIGIEKQELEERIYSWNSRNKIPLRGGYVKSQLLWSYRNKIVLPPNFDKDYYKGIGVIPTEEEIKLKNPVNYVLKKNKIDSVKETYKNKQDNFKN